MIRASAYSTREQVSSIQGQFSKVYRHGSFRMRIPAQTNKRLQDKLTDCKSPGGMGDVERRKGEDRETNP